MKKHKPKVYMTVGPPGSGKGNWVKKKVTKDVDRQDKILAKYNKDSDDISEKMDMVNAQMKSGIWVINSNKILTVLYGGTLSVEEYMHNVYIDIMKGLLFNALRTGRDIVLEGQFINVNDRRQFVSSVNGFNHSTKNARYELIAMKFPIAFEFCLKEKLRNTDLSTIKWRRIIKSSIKAYQAPTKKEGFGRIIRVS